jgi:hypothetical protein
MIPVTCSAPFPVLGIQAIQDTPAVPEAAVSSSSVPESVRQCVCPPGGIAVDNTTGPHSGRIYISYSYQHGTAISYADLISADGVRTAGTWSAPIAIPGSGTSGSAFEDEWNFDPIAVDGTGTVYVAWAHANGFDPSTNLAGHGVEIDYAYSKDGGSTWTGPFTLSTEAGTTTFPTMTAAGNGVLDVAWYGDPAHAVDPQHRHQRPVEPLLRPGHPRQHHRPGDLTADRHQGHAQRLHPNRRRRLLRRPQPARLLPDHRRQRPTQHRLYRR